MTVSIDVDKSAGFLLTNHRTKRGDGCIGQENKGENHRAIFVRHQLSNGNIKAQLHSLAETIHSSAHYERIDILGKGTNDDPSESNNVASDEEPSSTEEI